MTDGSYIYYYNDTEKRVSILSSPLDLSTSRIDLNDAKVLKEIRIPETFWGTELYLTDEKLIILAQRRTNNDNQ
jgi:hypothetical protein